MFGQTTFFSIITLFFREKCEFYLFYYSSLKNDLIAFKRTRSSIDTDVILVKKPMPF